MNVCGTFDHFFDLPGELREQILGLLLIKQGGIIISSDKRMLCGSTDDEDDEDDEESDEESDDGELEYDPEDFPAWPVNYFLVNQAFNLEATAVYFRENTFYIHATGRRYVPHHPPPADDDLRAVYTTGERLRPAPPAAPPAPGEALLNRPEWARSRRRIRRAVLCVQRPRGALSRDVAAPLLDMILAGGLRTLEVRLLRGSVARGPRVLASAPLRSLYRVLSDPDLDAARLRVPARGHEDFWCVFHEGGGGGGGLARGCARAGDDGVEGAWVDIDIRALIRKHGGVEEQLRIFKVGD